MDLMSAYTEEEINAVETLFRLAWQAPQAISSEEEGRFMILLREKILSDLKGGEKDPGD